MAFTGIVQPEEFRTVTRAQILAWRAELEKQPLAGATIWHKLTALASLCDYLCESNAVTHNPVRGVKRPKAETSEGKTPTATALTPCAVYSKVVVQSHPANVLIPRQWRHDPLWSQVIQARLAVIVLVFPQPLKGSFI